MKRILSMCGVVAALACSSVKDKQECSVSTDCPVGQYCARAGGEARCWADSVSPVVGTVTASCTPSPCPRDGVLHVEADVTDDAEVLDAAVALSLSGASPVPLSRSGSTWTADVQLREVPFPFLSNDQVNATVTARDGARNTSNTASSVPVAVTRLRWERVIKTGTVVTPTSPAVKSDGTVVIGGSDGKLYFVAPDGSDGTPQPLAVAAGSNTAAPSVGADTIWVGSEDGKLYGVELNGTAVKIGVAVNTGGVIRGAVAVLPGTGKDWAFATSNAGFVGAVSSTGENVAAGPTAPFSVGPVGGLDGRAYAVTTVGLLHAYRLTTSPALSFADVWSTPVDIGGGVTAPLAVDGDGTIWTGAVDGKLAATVPGDTSGTPRLVTTIARGIVGSPVVLANGDVVVGDIGGLLHRISPSGVDLWTPPPVLENPADGPLVLAGGDAALLVPAGGKIFALHGDGSQVWSGALDSGTLRAANLYTPPGQTGTVMSTAYLTSSSGKLFAVIVDGQLDAAAPWPKAFHDPRNTNRAGPQP